MAKIELHPDFKDFLKLLNLNAVRYLVIGGISIDFISLPMLKTNKKASARLKDLEDLRHLP
jgi:hypothetical protein